MIIYYDNVLKITKEENVMNKKNVMVKDEIIRLQLGVTINKTLYNEITRTRQPRRLECMHPLVGKELRERGTDIVWKIDTICYGFCQRNYVGYVKAYRVYRINNMARLNTITHMFNVYSQDPSEDIEYEIDEFHKKYEII
jgi:hypothetical protein